MKFFWKIFFTTMFVSVICFAAGGYAMTYFNFNALLDSGVQSTYDFGDIVSQTLANEVKGLEEIGAGVEQSAVTKIAKSVNISSTNVRVSFCLLSKEGNELFTSLAYNFDKELLKELKENERGWRLKKSKEKIYVQAVRPATLGNNTYYIETIQDVSNVFESQKQQYTLLLSMIGIMLVVAGAITVVVTKLLMRQVVSLTVATKEISAGNLERRVVARGEDEFALLSQNFNAMADNLEDKILQLEEETERKEMFVGNFSHELKTPLTSIIGYADMLRSRDMDKERIRFCAEYIFTEGKRLEGLSMRLLELIVLGKQEVYLKDTSMKALLEQVEAVVMPQLYDEKIHLTMDVDEGLVALEPELMKTVFINLIDNGRKAIDGGGEISVIGKKEHGRYYVVIQDSGKGMDKSELSKINEAFYMVDKSRSRRQGGAGLGLAICEQILSLHRFTMKFDSVVGVGTRVIVELKGANNE